MSEGYAKYTVSFINNSPSLVIRVEHGKELENALTSILPDYRKFVDAIKNATEKKQEQIANEQPPAPTEPRYVPVQEPRVVPVAQPQAVQPQTPQQFEQKCEDCGSLKIKSMKGNMYCPNKCWLNK